MHQNTQHTPVLLASVLHYLHPVAGESYADMTAGYGGHALAIAEQTKQPVVLVDRDDNAVTFLRTQFSVEQAKIIDKDFLTAAEELRTAGERFDMVLADLGVSSPHLNNADRGFVISQDGPLDMRMDQRSSLTAETIVNTYEPEELVRILKEYGEEPKAVSISRSIVQARPIHTTVQLAAIVAKHWPGHSRVHPATRTFQALRIAVNDELGLLERALPVWIDLLKPGGRLAVISFHSLEDRLVKRAFQERTGDRYDATLRDLTRRPVMAETNEVISNPRSRSAKLRVVAKIKINTGRSL